MSRRWLGLTWRSVRPDVFVSDEPQASLEFYHGEHFGYYADFKMDGVDVCGFANTKAGARRDVTVKLRTLARLVK